MKKILISFLSASLLFSCSSDSDDDSSVTGGGSGSDTSDSFETNTQNITVSNAITIVYNEDNTVTITNPYTDLVSITTEGANVVATSTTIDTQLNYVLSGKTTAGSFKLYSDYKFGIVLNGTSIISASGPAINIQSSKKGLITLTSLTKNRLVDGTYTENSTEDMKGTLFSEGQLVFEGTGSLQVIGQYKHAIASDDYIRINSGVFAISSTLKDGINVNNYFELNGGTVSITSTGDGVKCTKGYVNITGGSLVVVSTAGDGVKTSYSGSDTSIDKSINLTGGTVALTLQGAASKGVKSKGDINISDMQLTITSSGDAYYNTSDADVTSSASIKSDGNVVISDGSVITIVSSGKGGKGINVHGTLTIDGGTISVTTTGDQYVYNSNNDTAAKAIKSDGNLTINGGTVVISTSKTEAEGLESKATLTINGGVVEVKAYDDCINASNHIEITGGTIYCLSTTNDAIDSNGTMTISGGTVIAIGSSAPEAGFDCDDNTFKITGGTLIGFGGSTSTPTNSVCTQRSVVYGGSSYDIMHIESSSGESVLTFKLPKTFSSTTMLYSSPSLVSGTYNIYTGGSISGGTESYGLYSGATYTKGTLSNTFTASSMVTKVGTFNGGGGPR